MICKIISLLEFSRDVGCNALIPLQKLKPEKTISGRAALLARLSRFR